MKVVLAYFILTFSIQAVVYAAEPANTADGQEVQDKISGTQICAKPKPVYNIPVSNQSNRLYSISQMKCTWTNLEIAGVEIKDETSTCFAEAKSEEVRFNCFSHFTASEGERFSGRWVGSFNPNDEVKVVSCTLSILKGDSKLKGLSSKWTCKVKYASDGTATSDCEGTRMASK